MIVSIIRKKIAIVATSILSEIDVETLDVTLRLLYLFSSASSKVAKASTSRFTG